jgi:aldehyde:ferredoxin oxidoreductase
MREGFTSESDILPRRVMMAFDSGPLNGIEITQERFDWAKQRYYELMRWDSQGRPGEDCLKQLDLLQIIDL